ncbi:hypothetical protein [Hydrogenophaga sp. ANAO-22]|uniref:hypothetical protein n=1 Tax=Hydrogenophaga sp. ANAO-22 TaxID=3166645 RepID=UPI0036D2FFD6
MARRSVGVHRIQQALGRVALHFTGQRQLLGTHAFIGEPLAQLLAHEHGLVAQLQPHGAPLRVFETDGTGAAFHRVHVVPRVAHVLHLHDEEPLPLGGHDLHSRAEFAGDVAEVHALRDREIGFGEVHAGILFDRRHFFHGLGRGARQRRAFGRGGGFGRRLGGGLRGGLLRHHRDGRERHGAQGEDKGKDFHGP